MRNAIIAGLVAAVGLIAAAPASANSDTCRDADGTCTAVVQKDRVDFASVRTGATTRAKFVLRCHKGSASTVNRGFVPKGTRRVIEPTLNNPSCILRAKGLSRHTARVRVGLI